MNGKISVIVIVAAVSILTITFCFIQPKMHKPFQLNIIEYLIKINNDGSMTTIKSITTEVRK